MMTRQQYITASRIGVSVTLPEPERDIDAQLRALIDPDHPKHAVFLARGNRLGQRTLPDGIFVEERREGTLITDSATLALAFRQTEHITDAEIAFLLGYPEAKADVMQSDDGVVVQALDKDGNVVMEAATSSLRLTLTKDAVEAQTPLGGRCIVTTPQAALARRIAGMN